MVLTFKVKLFCGRLSDVCLTGWKSLLSSQSTESYVLLALKQEILFCSHHPLV